MTSIDIFALESKSELPLNRLLNIFDCKQVKLRIFCKIQCVPLCQIPFKEDASDFWIFWSTHVSKSGERQKKIEILRWPLEIAS